MKPELKSEDDWRISISRSLVVKLRNHEDLEGAEEELSQIYAQIYRVVARDVNKGFRHKLDPDDIVVSTIRTFFKSGPAVTFDGPEDLRRYLFRIAVNKTAEKRRELRSQKRDLVREVSLDEQAESDAVTIDGREVARRMADLFFDVRDKLGERHAKILELYYEFDRVVSSVVEHSGLSRHLVEKMLREIRALFEREA